MSSEERTTIGGAEYVADLRRLNDATSSCREPRVGGVLQQRLRSRDLFAGDDAPGGGLRASGFFTRAPSRFRCRSHGSGIPHWSCAAPIHTPALRSRQRTKFIVRRCGRTIGERSPQCGRALLCTTYRIDPSFGRAAQTVRWKLADPISAIRSLPNHKCEPCSQKAIWGSHERSSRGVVAKALNFSFEFAAG